MRQRRAHRVHKSRRRVHATVHHRRKPVRRVNSRDYCDWRSVEATGLLGSRAHLSALSAESAHSLLSPLGSHFDKADGTRKKDRAGGARYGNVVGKRQCPQAG
ncbi:hypothetical protein BCV70DRAFT_336 [Testicularia cyperi]|uniref:Uncharacterized protein n=1 Tax=Testicularia cyperi TaxID=1882483 RepID=A0A317XWG8_9BASI|nr:hypothetical protein BCV70DRAFT_336 [Testicularia cyperi]